MREESASGFQSSDDRGEEGGAGAGIPAAAAPSMQLDLGLVRIEKNERPVITRQNHTYISQ